MSTEVVTLKCSRCLAEKPVSEFYLANKSARGYQYNCKQCCHERHLKNWAINGESGRKACREYRLKNLESQRERCRKWHAKNRDKVLERLNKIPKEKRAEYSRRHRNESPQYKLSDNMRRRINELVRGSGKSERTFVLVGCSVSDLRAHLESLFKPGMSWENYGKFGWHIDHKRPCASFDLTDPDQQKECFHFTNLQPLWWSENLAKSASYQCPKTGEVKYFRAIGNQYTEKKSA